MDGLKNTNIKEYILHNIPTKLLLKSFKTLRWKKICELNTIPTYLITSNTEDELVNKYIKVVMGKFAYWNPNKGKAYYAMYSSNELKKELNSRENI